MKITVNSHVEKRAVEYPPLEEQLDMLWHAMDRGEAPKAEPWYSAIKAVKARHPKADAPS